MELVIVLMIMLIIVAVAAIKLNDSGPAFPFKKKGSLLTPVEQNFLKLLEASVGHQYRVIGRVRLSDILATRRGTDRKTGRTAMAKAGGRQLDFVLCDKEDMTPVIAVDLVHQNGKGGYKAQRDWFVSGALDAARIPHLRIRVKSGYRPQEIRDCIEAKLAPVRYKEPKPLIQGSKSAPKTRLTRPIAA